MKLRNNKSIFIPSILACCSFMIAAPCSAAALPTGENIADSSRQAVDVSPNQPGGSTAYQYTGSEWLDITQVFQKNKTVYLRLAPEGAMDAPGPLVLPQKMSNLFIKNTNNLKGWYMYKYMRYIKYPNVQELRFDFYDKNQQYQGTASTTYWLL
ncbi:hypothetical protein ABE48_06985 [Bacillus thuringiensis]|uniref:hypothetical protein n=1 Tax=Bacillus TaxID=1386 RepID=UPI00077A3423|nr:MULTISPECIES: hypothetical protein [Bacillus cereus group]AZR80713.1 hypothetical protein BtSCAC15_31820 [Bacillus thuringiensis]KXY26310.1 hypothetical protein AT267_09590 [Bacillus cereus]MBG9522341.1 hypothetical protein [Bacillus thuringiensis]MBG9530916.1 hypothetical protein [Bacillus thuringiensis]